MGKAALLFTEVLKNSYLISDMCSQWIWMKNEHNEAHKTFAGSS